MAKKSTSNIDDYINDYEHAMQDYTEMGPLWAEMIFGDDFEAMKALYGRNDKSNQQYNQSSSSQNDRGGKRR